VKKFGKIALLLAFVENNILLKLNDAELYWRVLLKAERRTLPP
jgi:hypothetical protein